MDFFGVGISELFIIIIFCLIFFKPEELPGIVRAIISHVKKFRTMTVKVKQEIGDIYHREIESKFEEAKEELEKSTFEFKSQVQEEYRHINHELENVKNEIELSNEIKPVDTEVNPIINTKNTSSNTGISTDGSLKP